MVNGKALQHINECTMIFVLKAVKNIKMNSEINHQNKTYYIDIDIDIDKTL